VDEECSEWDRWLNWTTPGACEEPDSVVEAAVDALAGSIGEEWVKDIKNGVSDAIKTMVTFWVDVPDPDIGTVQGARAEVIMFLQDRLLWIGAVVMVFTVLFQTGKIIFEMNGQPAKDIFKMLIIYMGTVAMLIPSVIVGLMITNAAAQWILLDSTSGTNFADNLFSLFNSTAGVTGSIILCILLIIAAILAGLQCLIMIGRSGSLFVLLGFANLQAARTATPAGQESYKTTIAWIVGLVAYKLVAAGIYAVGFRFLGTDLDASGNGMLQIFYGLTLLMMAIFALPATMRLVVPSIAPVAGNSGAGAAVGSAATIATGTALRAVR
jgi:hypothetical protein